MDLINKLKDSFVDELVWRDGLKEPFTAEHKLRLDPNYLHTHQSFFVAPNKLPLRFKQTQNTELIIGEVMFLYCDDRLDKFEESYWICIGKTTNKNRSGIYYYFMYEAGCCGLCSESKLFLGDTLRDIVEFALTDSQRRLVSDNLVL